MKYKQSTVVKRKRSTERSNLSSSALSTFQPRSSDGNDWSSLKQLAVPRKVMRWRSKSKADFKALQNQIECTEIS